MTEQNIYNNPGPELPLLTAKPSSQLNHPWLILAVIALVALITDRIFIGQDIGLQWVIFVALVLLAIAVSVRIERLDVPKRSYWLFLPIAALTLLNLFRTESFTTIALIGTTIVSFVWLATSFLNGQWASYRLREHISQTFKLAMDAISGLPIMLIEHLRLSNAVKKSESVSKTSTKTTWAVLRGVLISLPILGVFGALLASADAVFSGNLKNLFAWVGDFRLGRFFGEAIVVCFITYILFGLFSFGLTKTRQSPVTEPDQASVKTFLGMTEASIVLGSVNILFLAFLVVQFRYFFAGQVNISESGLTYSEYAVKGFQELIMVACVALGLHWLLAGVTRRKNSKQKTIFSVLVTLVIVQVGIILFSAFQRLSLYEAAYGFTQSRLVAHVFMIFVGLMLIAALWMQWRDAFKHQALVLLSLFIVFALTLGLINVDRTVAGLNLAKAVSNSKLDASFLANQMSADALPLMFEYYDGQSLPPEVHEKLGKALACKANFVDQARIKSEPWFSVSLPDRAAAKLFEEHSTALSAYKFEQKTWGDGYVEKGFTIDDVWIGCNYSYHPAD
ncbi:MAG: DUF4173 domain-containing protein [Anaerolineaceae bacterium]